MTPGTPADAERYPMWTDAATNVTRNFIVKVALGPLVSYERGAALQEAGNGRAAAYQLQRFVESYDQPPAAHRLLLDDAKARLSQLDATDAPRRPVAPKR